MDKVIDAFAQAIGQIGVVGTFVALLWAMFLWKGKWLLDLRRPPLLPPEAAHDLGSVAGSAVERAVERMDDYTERLLVRIREDRRQQENDIRDTKEAVRRIEGGLSAPESRDIARDTQVSVGRMERMQTQEMEHLSNIVLNEARVVEVLERIEKSQADAYRTLSGHARTDEEMGERVKAQLGRMQENIARLEQNAQRGTELVRRRPRG